MSRRWKVTCLVAPLVALANLTPAVVLSVPGTGVGAIPDGLAGTPPQYGAPLVINFPVTGNFGRLLSVTVSLTLSHTRVGDLDVVLHGPRDEQSLGLVSRLGAPADDELAGG